MFFEKLVLGICGHMLLIGTSGNANPYVQVKYAGIVFGQELFLGCKNVAKTGWTPGDMP